MPCNRTSGPDELKQVVLEYFSKYYRRTSEGLEFNLMAGEKIVAREHWNIQGLQTPKTKGIWTVSSPFSQPRDLFIAFSATDILCFCHFYTNWLKSSNHVAFLAVGTRPDISKVKQIREMFPLAKVHLLFDNDLIGRVTDCKISVWLSKRNVVFELTDSHVKCKTRDGTFWLGVEMFSLHQFIKVSGFRTNVRTHKPRKGFGSFYNLFTGSNY